MWLPMRTEQTRIDQSDSTNGAREGMPIITQAQLSEYLALRDCRKRYDAVRSEIVAELMAGADIEDGPLSASIEQKSSQRFSFPTVAAVLGHAAATQLRSQIEPTVSTCLLVGERE